MEPPYCPVCKVPNTDISPNLSATRYVVRCPNCGPFEISRSAFDEFVGKLTPVEGAIVSHAVFRMHDRADPPYLDTYTIKQLLGSTQVPGHTEQAENLILVIGHELDQQGRPGGSIREEHSHLRAAIGAVDTYGVTFIIDELEEQGLVRTGVLGLTFKGWDRYRDLLTRGTTARIAFMAMQYGDSVLEKMFEDCFRPAVKDTGFDLRRLDQVPRAGLIDNHLRVEIRNARFLLADLTHGNRGAYWEGGFAEGLDKPVIYLCEKSVFEDQQKRPHFDTNHCQTVVWSEDDPEECAKQLKATIRVTLPGEAKQTDD